MASSPPRQPLPTVRCRNPNTSRQARAAMACFRLVRCSHSPQGHLPLYLASSTTRQPLYRRLPSVPQNLPVGVAKASPPRPLCPRCTAHTRLVRWHLHSMVSRLLINSSRLCRLRTSRAPVRLFPSPLSELPNSLRILGIRSEEARARPIPTRFMPTILDNRIAEVSNISSMRHRIHLSSSFSSPSTRSRPSRSTRSISHNSKTDRLQITNNLPFRTLSNSANMPSTTKVQDSRSFSASNQQACSARVVSRRRASSSAYLLGCRPAGELYICSSQRVAVCNRSRSESHESSVARFPLVSYQAAQLQ